MNTLTIELPEPLSREIQRRGISQHGLENAVIRFVEIYLQELKQTSGRSLPLKWSDGADYARRVIANNRDLFEELSRL